MGALGTSRAGQALAVSSDVRFGAYSSPGRGGAFGHVMSESVAFATLSVGSEGVIFHQVAHLVDEYRGSCAEGRASVGPRIGEDHG